MQRMSFLLLLLSLLALNACGSLGFSPGGRHKPQQHQGTVTLSQMLAELDALKAPPGQTEDDFNGLKQSLRNYLVHSGETKFTASAPTGDSNAVDNLTPDILLDDQGEEINRVSWSYRNIGDYDQNSEVNVADLSALGSQLGKSTASPDWETKAKYSDGDGNGEVNISDITPLGSHLLSQVSAYRLESGDTADGPWTAVTDVDFDDGEKMPSGQRMFVVPVSAPLAPFYRVVPIDSVAGEGVPSLPSQAFILSDKAEIVGKPNGVQFVSLNGHTLVLEAPDSTPTTISVGDVIVGNDGDGYLWHVLTVVQDGTTVTVTGEEAAITDLIVKGVIDMSKLFAPDQTTSMVKNGSKVTSAPHHLLVDCANGPTTMGSFDVDIKEIIFEFAPDLEVKMSVNGEADPDNPVQAFVTKLTTDTMTCSIDATLENAVFSGSFPPTPGDMAYTHMMATLPFSFDAEINGVPFAATWSLDLHFAIAGSGDFNGDYQFDSSAQYTGAVFGGWWNPLQGWQDYNTFASAYSDPDAGTKPEVYSASAGPCQLQFYVEGMVDAKLYDDPDRMTQLTFSPSSQLDLTPTNTPSAGDNYTINGFIHLGRNFMLGTYGTQNLDHNTPFNETPAFIDSGFLPRTVEPDEIGGTFTEDTSGDGVGDTPLAGAVANLYDMTIPASPVLIDSQFTAADGTYSFASVAHPLDVKIEASHPSYSFDPLSIEFNYTGGKAGSNDFVGTATSTDKSISGTITDGTDPIVGLEVGGSITGFPGTLWMDTTDASGNYTLNGISPGLNVTVTPDPNNLESYDFTPLTRDYPNVNSHITGADFTGTLVTTWTHSLGFNLGQDEVISGITSDAAGNVYVCGYAVEPSPSADKMALVAKYSPTGTLLWSHEEGVSFIGEAYFTSIAVDAGGIYTVGSYDNENTFNHEILVMKWDGAGNVVWKKSWGLGATSNGWACALDTFGNLYVGGECSNGVTGQDPVIIKYDSSGTILWQKAYAVAGTDFIRGGVYDSGNFYLTGHATNTAPTSSEDIVYLKIFNDGSVAADKLLDIGDLYNAGLSVQVDGGFNTYIGGSTVAASGLTSEATIVKLDPVGTPIGGVNWSTSNPGATFHQFNSIRLDGFGNILGAGYWSDGTLHGALAKFDTLMAPQGSSVYLGAGETRLFSAAISNADGDLLLGGYAPDATGSWSPASSNTGNYSVTALAYGGTIVDVAGVVNPSSPFTNDYISVQDLGNGGKDGLAIKRAKP